MPSMCENSSVQEVPHHHTHTHTHTHMHMTHIYTHTCVCTQTYSEEFTTHPTQFLSHLVLLVLPHEADGVSELW